MRVVLSLSVVLLVLVSLLTGCGAQAPVLSDENKDQFSRPLIRGTGLAITGSHIFDRLQFSEFGKPGGVLPEADLRRFIDTLLLDTLTGLEAKYVDLRDHYTDYWSFRLRYQDFGVRAFFDETIGFKVTADSAEAVAYYEAHKDQFSYKEQVELYHILISPTVLARGPDSSLYGPLDSAALDAVARDYAFALYDSINAGAVFERIAGDHSHDQLSVLSGGYIGWTPRERYIDPFDSVAFSLQKGEMAPPYRDRDGWHIIMISDRVDEGPAPITDQKVFDAARDFVRAEKIDTRSQQVIDSLMSGVQYVFHDPLLDSNSSQIDDTVWAAIVDGRDTIDFRYLKNYETEYILKYGQGTLTPVIKRSLLYQIGRRFVIMRALAETGLDQRDYIQLERQRLEHIASKSVLEALRFDPSWRPDDSTVRAYFDEHIDEFQIDRPLTVAVIYAGDSLLAVYLRDLANSGYDLQDLVDNYVPREQGMSARLTPAADVGPNDLPKQLYDMAMATRVGSTSEIARIDDTTFAMAKLLNRRQSQSFDQARGSIISRLTLQYRKARVEQTLASLKAKYNIEIETSLPQVRLRPYALRTRPHTE